jgi:hypothetical protein
MSGAPTLPLDPSIEGLDACGCCAGIGVQTPLQVFNRAGLPAIQYRIGTHGDFKASMLARLTAPDFPALQQLTTRDDSDPTIALIDATAVLADVLTFYQERIANESFLRTATQWRSLAALGQLTGYEPSPGLAATVFLAFTLETAADSPESATIPAGARIQSIPASGQLPQTFETAAPFVARPEWSAMTVLRSRPQQSPDNTTQSILVQGIANQVKAGERLLLAGGSVVKMAVAVTTDPASQTTRIDLATNAAPPTGPAIVIPPPGGLSALEQSALTTDALEQDILDQSWDAADLMAFIQSKKWSPAEVMTAVMAAPSAGGGSVIRFRQRASVFGHNAPAYDTLPASLRPAPPPAAGSGAGIGKVPDTTTVPYPDNWDAPANATLNVAWLNNVLDPGAGDENFGKNTLVQLDHVYSGLAPGGWVFLQEGSTGYGVATTLGSVGEISALAFTMSAKLTQIDLGSADTLPKFTRRGTTVFCDHEVLTLAPVPVTDPVQGSILILDRIYIGLQVGQYLAVSGVRADLSGVPGTELAQIAGAVVWGNLTVLTLTVPLAYAYAPQNVTINANVVAATHGMSISETLGSGDSTVPFQEFVLRQPPLTFVADASGAGPATTLTIRVNGETWSEVPTLYAAAPTDRVYVTWLADDLRTHVLFGDGLTGSRLPTGAANVTAAYRTGIGTPGLVGANAASMLMTRPLGVRSVTNPVAASGAADPDTPDMLRQAAPLHVMTLGRIVSLEDYARYALAYPGISKALASWQATVRGRGVRVTVAGQDGAAIDPAGPLGRSLLAAMRAAGNPNVAVTLADYAPVFFRLGVALATDPALSNAAVIAAVEAALRSTFALANRAFGQDVLASEVIAVIQGVPGVQACGLTLFCRPPQQDGVADTLAAAVPVPGAAAQAPAEILLLDPRPIAFGNLT